jgi:phosphoglycolate phosphatase
MIKLVIFDLDGTLLNTIDDLADCTNYVLKKNGFPIHKIDSYKFFVGNGVITLLQRALPKEIKENKFNNILKEFMDLYEIHKEDKTAPYEGMVETLENLQKMDSVLAVATNKPQELLPALMQRFFPTVKWAAVLGGRKNIPIKPNPQIVYDILNITKINNENILYVGDTAVDMETAKNAEITKVGALWGFRTKEELEKAGADYLIKKPQDLEKIILSQQKLNLT